MYWQSQLNTSLVSYANKLHISYFCSFPAFGLSVVCCFALYAFIIHRTPEMSIENIAQKSAADFMQIDEMDIIYIIVYNSWTTKKTVNAAKRPYKPRSAVFVFRHEIIRQRKVFSYTCFIQFHYSLF